MILSIIALPILLFIFIIIGPIIYFQDKGPIFYNSPRLGKDGRIFKMYKFRSMKVNSLDIRNEDGSTYNAENDPRVTKIGKFIRMTSIDETPQFINVIKGDMSIIGPRPDLPEMLNIYDEFKKVIAVRPGITGYSQAYYRNSIDTINKLNNDINYIENISFLFDIKIILKTIHCIVGRKNVFNNNNV